MNKPDKMTKKEYVSVMKAMGLKDPAGLYDSYSDAYVTESVEWFDTTMKDCPTDEDIELMFLKTA